jgi:hypothetical protein
MHIRVHNKGIVSKVLCIYVHYIVDTTPAGREGAAGQTDTLVSLTYFFKNFQTYFCGIFQTSLFCSLLAIVIWSTIFRAGLTNSRENTFRLLSFGRIEWLFPFWKQP